MKRSFKNLFIIVLVLISLMGSGVRVTPAYAQTGNMVVVPLALPADWTYGYLTGVWGSSANNLYAVGYGRPEADILHYLPLLYRKVGSDWTASILPLPGGLGLASGSLSAVWGSSANDVYAVGAGYNGTNYIPMLYHWNGGSWLSYTPPVPAGWQSGYLNGVWGSGANDVYAVGYGRNGGVDMPLLYHWDGRVWASIPLSLPAQAGWVSGKLLSVWGFNTDNIYAVGTGIFEANNEPLLYHWNGSAWTPSNSFLPAELNSGNGTAVWGASITDIYLVGRGNSGGNDFPVIYQGNGSNWTRPTLPSFPPEQVGYLQGIWGFSANDIYAVGYKDNGTTQVPLLYHNDGSGWSEASPSLPAGWRSDVLYGVWGADSGNVYAFGSGYNGSVYMPLLYQSSLADQDLTAPGFVNYFAASPGPYKGSVRLKWKAPVDDAGDFNSGPVASYVVKYSEEGEFNDDWLKGNTITSGIPVPTAPETFQTMIVTGLQEGKLYYFAIRAQDEQYNLSAIPSLPEDSATAGTENRLPGRVGLQDPSGAMSSNRITYTWNANNDATWYYLWVENSSGLVFQRWYTVNQVNCDVTCSIKPAGLTLSSGNYTWWIQTWNDVGYGPWSAGKGFSVPVPPRPGTVTLSSPSGSIWINNPTYSWSEDPDTTWYYLWVDGPSGNVIKRWYTAEQANCNGTTCSVASATPGLAAGTYTWWVWTWNETGYGTWSNGMSFTPTLPGQATLSLPKNSIWTKNPTYSWSEVPGATWYYLWVDGPSGNMIKRWYQASTICSNGTCSIKDPTLLGGGAHTWWIQTWNDVGYGSWSSGVPFTPSPPQGATLYLPTGTVPNNPTYSWSEVPGATWYYLWVDGPSGNVLKRWYTAADVNCDGATCSVANATPDLPAGNYTWWIQTWNEIGFGPWSSGVPFAPSP